MQHLNPKLVGVGPGRDLVGVVVDDRLVGSGSVMSHGSVVGCQVVGSARKDLGETRARSHQRQDQQELKLKVSFLNVFFVTIL